ncbi:hypothetical protein [Aequorivita echinoideorum]|uniref:Transmembrane protein n=1 Tax=Aequorivita echinoideorum TaxID=1549647 RepID=A0ABS5S1K5_9FLAO|nr:hypothetical protein [Aequorivita echinoideorum]MBT0607085.1 hypothetical protein [Aequorivita echinoideorum]
MKVPSIILMLVFANFLLAPAVIKLTGMKYDISSYFSMNEEENSSKSTKLSSEFKTDDHKSNLVTILFLKKQKEKFQYYLINYKLVFLEVVSPPPKFV